MIQKMRTWYPTVEYSNNVLKYLNLLQRTFRVMNADRRWIQYELTNHQKDWHAHDVALLHTKAKSRVVTKSRNTSFTVSTLVSNIAAVPFYPSVVVPFVRLNAERAIDLISDCKELIRNMNVVKWNGKHWPFNIDDVYMGNSKSITFPNGVEFRAFPANAQSANVIRGLRIAGNAGIVDESNFMRDFEDIYIALRDAASGSINGNKAFQMNIGTTLKGRATPFNIWYEKVKAQNILDIYKWPVFDPEEFDVSRSILEQPRLIPIVSWHNLQDLENKRREDKNRFLEEYMSELVDSDAQFYPFELIIKNIDDSLKTIINLSGNIYVGIDVASVNDFFVISVFEEINGIYYQRYLKYIRDVDVSDMDEECYAIFDKYKPIKVRIDANGIGFDMAQRFKKKYGSIIDPIKGGNIKGIEKRQSISLNEYMHVNQKRLMNDSRVRLFKDDMQVQHYLVWDYNYKAASTAEFGHGDIAIANGLALLPINYKMRKNQSRVITNLGFKQPVSEEEAEQIQKIQEEVEW